MGEKLGKRKMKEVEIESFGKKIISSGSFITISKSGNKLSFEYKEKRFNFELSFFKDDVKKESRINYYPNQIKDTLLLDFYNFENALGVGATNPIVVAIDDNKNMYANFVVYSINENIKKIVYTFYVDK